MNLPLTTVHKTAFAFASPIYLHIEKVIYHCFTIHKTYFFRQMNVRSEEVSGLSPGKNNRLKRTYTWKFSEMFCGSFFHRYLACHWFL